MMDQSDIQTLPVALVLLQEMGPTRFPLLGRPVWVTEALWGRSLVLWSVQSANNHRALLIPCSVQRRE